MDLEKMKKADLVQLARTTLQENKALRKEKAQAVTGDSLPFKGISVVRDGLKSHVVTLSFDFDSKVAKVDNVDTYDNQYELATYKAVQILEHDIESQGVE